MRYLIEYNTEPFFTNWFIAESHFVQGMVVYDLYNSKYTKDGVNWLEIKQDQL